MSVFIRSVLLFCCLHLGWLASPLQAQNLTNRGKEFWVAYAHNILFTADVPQNAQTMVLYLSAEAATQATVSIPATGWSQTVSIPANSVNVSVVIPKTGADDARVLSEGKSDRGIHVIADAPIVVYAHQYGTQSSAATMLFPADTYGYSYFSMNYEQVSNYANSFSWTLMVASEDNTRLEITPSDSTQGGWEPGKTYTIDLKRGEVYNVFGKQTGAATSKDMTGTKVVSVPGPDGKCHPFALYSGSSRMVICAGDGGEFMWQQMFPASAWGTSYLTYHTINNTSTNVNTPFLNFYRIGVADPTSVVKRNGTVLSGLKRNFFYEFSSTSGDYIEADKPIFVAQYMTSSNQCTGTANPPTGDPEMFVLSPLQQGIKQAVVYNTRNQNITTNYLDIIIHKEGLASLRVNGTPLAATSTVPHPANPDYVFTARRLLGAGTQYRITSDSAFVAKLYGLGSFESYGYLAGTALNNLNARSSIRNVLDQTNQPNLFTCPRSPFQLTLQAAYRLTSIQWHLSRVPGLLPSADITSNAPTPADSVIVAGRKYFLYTLATPLQLNVADTFYIPVTYTSPEIDRCDKQETVKLEVVVRQGPTANFTSSHSGCPADSVSFTQAATGNGLTINRYRWLLGDSTYTTANAKHRFAAGNHQPSLQVISTEGCVHDTSRPLAILPGPAAVFALSATGICAGDSIRLTDNSTPGTGTTLVSRNWRFGDNSSETRTTNAPFYHTYSTPGNYTLALVVVNNTGCPSDTTRQTLVVRQRPTASFTTTGKPCVGDSITLQSTANFAGSTTQVYNWDLGNGQRPSYTTNQPVRVAFNLVGASVTIKHWVAGDGGCSSDTAIGTPLIVLPKPVVQTSVATDSLCNTWPVAFSSTATISTGSIATYAWAFGDGGTANTANPRHTYTAAGSYTATLVVSSADGCATTTSLPALVIAQLPVVDAGPNRSIVAGNQTTLQATTNGNFGYLWTPATALSSSTVLQPIANPLQTTTYTLLATAPGGICRAFDTVRVQVLKGINIPSAFSPNGDGINDVWNIAGFTEYTQGELLVYDRYGNLVWRNLRTQMLWDGRVNGKQVPAGVYYYVLRLNDGLTPQRNGSVTLLR